jgi:hypothetical protein
MGDAGMTGRIRIATLALCLAAVGAGLSGCSGADSGVELNGKVFDTLGLSGAAKKASEPKLAERAPLVPPPRTDALPAPGSAQADAGHMAWPDDPDRRKAAAAAVQSKAANKYCTDPMIGRPDAERLKRDSDCADKNGGILATATGWLNPKKEGAATASADEGDPGLVTGSNKAPAATSATAQKAGTATKTR